MFSRGVDREVMIIYYRSYTEQHDFNLIFWFKFCVNFFIKSNKLLTKIFSKSILGTRFREGVDFGFVYMDIMHVYPEDAGSYTIKATNALGQAVNSADLHVQSKEVIVKETMHAAAMQQIGHLEQSSQMSQVITYFLALLSISIA